VGEISRNPTSYASIANVPRAKATGSAAKLVHDPSHQTCGPRLIGRRWRLLAVADRLEDRFHLAFEREAPGLRLREDQQVVDKYVELSG